MIVYRQLATIKFVTFQVILVVVGSILYAALGKLNSAASFGLGAVLMAIANFVFLSRFFIKGKRFSAAQELILFYLAELLKLVVVGLGSVLIAFWLNPLFLPYVIGLLVLQCAMWLLPFFIRAATLNQ